MKEGPPTRDESKEQVSTRGGNSLEKPVWEYPASSRREIPESELQRLSKLKELNDRASDPEEAIELSNEYCPS